MTRVSSSTTTGFDWTGAASNIGMGLQIGGLFASAIGSYYATKSAQYQAKSQALTKEFEQTMAYMDARDAEWDAQQMLRAGQEEKGRIGLQYGQVKESTITRQAAGGIQGGVGSAAEVAASIEYAKEADQLTITKNAVRASNARRKEAGRIRTGGKFAGLSAGRLRSAASSMSGGWAAFNTLMGGAGQVAGQWARDKRQSDYYKSVAGK